MTSYKQTSQSGDADAPAPKQSKLDETALMGEPVTRKRVDKYVVVSTVNLKVSLSLSDTDTCTC